MNFAAIAPNEMVFVDANVFVYAFADDPKFGDPCIEFLERIEQGDLQGYLSAAVLSDVAHRLMTLEACQSLGWPYAGIGNRLRNHPAQIQQLQRFRLALDDIVATGIHVLPVTAQHVLVAGDLSRQHGILCGDALIVAVMQSHGLTNLASNDADFDRVPQITRYTPI
jgi:predicted nucleic acid-binding protein